MKTVMLMLLCHLFADFTLQGLLGKMKTKMWWDDIFKYVKTEDGKPCYNKELYKYDWLCALLCHSLYWSLVTFLPLYSSPMWAEAVLANAALHALVDHLKANAKLINLWHDQTLHVGQIIATYIVLT